MKDYKVRHVQVTKRLLKLCETSRNFLLDDSLEPYPYYKDLKIDFEINIPMFQLQFNLLLLARHILYNSISVLLLST